MKLYGELIKKAGIKEAFYPSRCVLFIKDGAYLQGVKTVSEYTDERIVVYFKQGKAELTGRNIRIIKYTDGDVELTGEVENIRITNAKKVTEGGER